MFSLNAAHIFNQIAKFRNEKNTELRSGGTETTDEIVKTQQQHRTIAPFIAYRIHEMKWYFERRRRRSQTPYASNLITANFQMMPIKYDDFQFACSMFMMRIGYNSGLVYDH